MSKSIDQQVAELQGLEYHEGYIRNKVSSWVEYKPSQFPSQAMDLVKKYHIQFGWNDDMTCWASPVDEYPGKYADTPEKAIVLAVIALLENDK